MSLQHYATVLADGIATALPGWVERSVQQRAEAAGLPFAGGMAEAARAAGQAAAADVGPRVRALLAADVDEQRSNPLALVRVAVRYPTAVLADAGVPPVERDEQQAALFPDDPYDLTPATWADLDPELAEAGIAWGAAKAWTHRQRHQGRA